MNFLRTRRQFIQTTAAAGLAAATPWTRAASEPLGGGRPFSFVLLGDLHYDRLEHHDLSWVRAEKPNDLGQIENYTRITRDIHPMLLASVRAKIAELRSAEAPVAFVLQAGDLVEGLCGSEELSVRQNTEALDFIRAAQLGVPWLFTKGNHDITGPGATAAFSRVFHPFLTKQARLLAPASPEIGTARFALTLGNAEFVFFDAYDAAASLEWFEGIVAQRQAEHLFVVVHPPVVPYGARSTWHLFSSEREKVRREKFLSLLGDQRALVLGGHIHKYNTLSREAGRGRFGQFALSSIIPNAQVKPRHELSGVADYTGDQVRVEPDFSRGTETERRAIYAAERHFVKHFTYADLPGYAVVTVKGSNVTLDMHVGVSRERWRSVDLSALARG